MKKLLVKDKKLRGNYKTSEKNQFVLKSISNNFNYLKLIRWNASQKLKEISTNSSKSRISNRCYETIHKKRLNKNTYYSRHVFLNLIRSGKISGIRKSSW